MSTGFFGKLPSAGDFVARGVAAPIRRALDGWVTAHIARLAADARHWPEGGVRAAFEMEGAPWLVVIEPGEDAVGRSYPLAACVALNGADRAAADIWADAAATALVRALDTGADPDALHHALSRIAPPRAAAAPLVAPCLWWDRIPEASPQERLPRLAQISSG